MVPIFYIKRSPFRDMAAEGASFADHEKIRMFDKKRLIN